MSKAVLDADEVLRHATPLVHQQAHETQPYGHIIRMPIALAESVCAESVEQSEPAARRHDHPARPV